MTATARRMTPARLRSLFRSELTAARKTYRALGWMTAIRGLRNVEVKVSGQLTRAAGSCTFRTGQPCLIKLSSKILCHESVPESEILDTIRHEIAHAAAGLAAQHGPIWVRCAQAIGCNGEQFHSLHDACRAAARKRTVVEVSCSHCDRAFGKLSRVGETRVRKWLDRHRCPCGSPLKGTPVGS